MTGLLVWIFVGLGVLLRLAGVHRPLLGNFSAYQTGQAMMAQFFSKDFSSMFYPQVYVLAGGKPGVTLLYYPVSALIASFSHRIFGQSLDLWGRLQAVLFFSASCIYLYRLLRRWLNEELALISVVAFSLSPLSIIYGQSFQNEMATVFFTLSFLLHMDRFLKKFSHLDFFLSSFSLSLVLLTRPNCIYILLLPFYKLLKGDYGLEESGKRWKEFFAASALGLVLPVAWFSYTWFLSKSQAANIYSSVFAQLQVKSSLMSTQLLNFDYFKKLVDLLAGNVLSPIGFTLLIVGMITALCMWSQTGIFVIWCAAYFVTSFLLTPRKIIEHEFYLLQLVLPASALIAFGFQQLLRAFQERRVFQKAFIFFFLIISTMVSLRYAFHPAFKTTEREQNFIEIGDEIHKITSQDKSKIIVQGNHTLLYYADRFGWGLEINKKDELQEYQKFMLSAEAWEKRKAASKSPITNLEYLRQEGATHFVVSDSKEFYQSQEFAEYMNAHYPVVAQKQNVFIIYNLDSTTPSTREENQGLPYKTYNLK